MTVILVGEILNSCDAITGFNVGNINATDDDFVEGTGAIGLKASAGITEMRTTTLGPTAPYDFSSAGTEFGAHIIMWFNTKTPINTTTGLGVVVGNGTDYGVWDVLGSSFYKGGFTTRVIDTGANFDTISAGTWATTGNPAQLSNINDIGGNFVTLTSIMGNFNNIQLDQMTVGSGLRVYGGSYANPNDFEEVRVADEDTAFYGWWSSAVGANVGKGKLFVGPQDGSAESVFIDNAFSVAFADEIVGSGFYEIALRGEVTAVFWELETIAAANPNQARWSFTMDPSTSGFYDTNGVWSGADQIVLSASGHLDGTTIINSNNLFNNSGTLDSVTVLSSPQASFSGFLHTEDLGQINDCRFESDGTGHAIQLNSLGHETMTWNNTVIGYASTSGSTGNEAIFINVPTGGITINVLAGATTPSIRTAGAFVNLVVNPVTTLVTVTDVEGSVLEGARVYMIAGTGGPLSQGTEIFNTLTNVDGEVSDTRALASNQPVTGWVRFNTSPNFYKQSNIAATIDSDNGLSLTIQLVSDE